MALGCKACFWLNKLSQQQESKGWGWSYLYLSHPWHFTVNSGCFFETRNAHPTCTPPYQNLFWDPWWEIPQCHTSLLFLTGSFCLKKVVVSSSQPQTFLKSLPSAQQNLSLSPGLHNVTAGALVLSSVNNCIHFCILRTQNRMQWLPVGLRFSSELANLIIQESSFGLSQYYDTLLLHPGAKSCKQWGCIWNRKGKGKGQAAAAFLPTEQTLALRHTYGFGFVWREDGLEQDRYHEEVSFLCSLPQTLLLQMLGGSISFPVPKLH